jgi:ketosteroid isomerase-like protein
MGGRSVSEENLDTIRRLYELWNGEQGMLAAMPLFDPEIQYVNPESAIEPGTRQGIGGMVKALESVDGSFAEYVHEPERLLDAGGDKVLAYVVFRAHGRDSGASVEKPEQHVWTLRDGKIVRFEWFHDEDAARRAAGL